MKYVLVTGGVVSGLGKGVTASSIGLLLKACGLRVTSIKIGIFLSLSSMEIIIFEGDLLHLLAQFCQSVHFTLHYLYFVSFFSFG